MFNLSTSSGTNGEVDCPQSPSDTPTDVCWFWPNPQNHPLLCATAWDGTARVWEVRTSAALLNRPTTGYNYSDPTIAGIDPKAMYTHTSALFSAQFIPGPALVLGASDGKILSHNLQTNQNVQIGQHDGPVRRVFWYEKKSLICGVSWDTTIKWWDARSPTPVAQINMPDNVPANEADMNGDTLAVSLLDKRIFIYDFRLGSNQGRKFSQDPLTYPCNVIKLFPDNQGAVVGTAEGRCRIFHFDPNVANQPRMGDFNFRAHRTTDSGEPLIGTGSHTTNAKIFPVYAMDFNPIYKTLATSGGDGYVYIWDKENRSKLHVTTCYGLALPCIRFDVSGRLMALGMGYDWAMGINGRKTDMRTPRVTVLPVKDTWIKNKKKI